MGDDKKCCIEKECFNDCRNHCCNDCCCDSGSGNIIWILIILYLLFCSNNKGGLFGGLF